MVTRICPPDHSHGQSQTCYSHGCRCTDCRALHTDYAFWRRNMIRAGRGPVRSIDARGTRRRIEALMALGWPAGELGRRLGGVTFQQINIYRTEPRVAPATAERVAALYEQLWNEQPVPMSRSERNAVTRARSFARARGFALPMEWDDIDADEAPQEGIEVDVDEAVVALAVDGLKPRMRTPEREEAVRLLNSEGMTDPAIADTLGCHAKTVLAIRQRLRLPERFNQINGLPGYRREDAA